MAMIITTPNQNFFLAQQLIFV